MSSRDDEIRAQTLALVQSYATLIAQQRFDEWIELWAEDGVCEFPYSPPGRQAVYTGKQEILAYMAATPGKMVIDEMVERRVHPMLNPAMVAAELTIKGRALTTGKPYNQRYVAIFEAKDGKLWRYREYWNPLISIEAFGEEWVSSFGKPQKGAA